MSISPDFWVKSAATLLPSAAIFRGVFMHFSAFKRTNEREDEKPAEPVSMRL